tara:strand:- start:3 stop:1103 length:1101 start_codon:yes stop_codon:yes gene_type:complete
MKKIFRRTILKNIIVLLIGLFSFKYIKIIQAMEKKPYHHLEDGTFRNPPGSPERDWSNSRRSGNFFKFFYEGIVKKRIFGKKQIPDYIPDKHFISEKLAIKNFNNNKDPISITWLGHATFLIRINETNILTDPFLSDHAGPYLVGPKRFIKPGIRIRNLPKIDIILISHNHYDHLDTRTLSKINGKKRIKVIVPLKLKKIIEKQGYQNIHEVDWYDETEINQIKIKSVPAIHWSRRLGQKRNETLWCGYAITINNKKIYFSGDVAYGEVFSEIGKNIGPFDLSIVSIGAYEPREMMRTSHVTPEEAVQVTKDIKSQNILGMHWGTIRLSAEDLWEPPKRFAKTAKLQGYSEKQIWQLAIGETKSLL